MRLVLLFADHESSSIRQWDITFRVPHPYVLRLEVAVHHKASHKKVFAETKCWQLPGSDIYGHTYFHTPSNFQGG